MIAQWVGVSKQAYENCVTVSSTGDLGNQVARNGQVDPAGLVLVDMFCGAMARG